jgi:hypothetical protein
MSAGIFATRTVFALLRTQVSLWPAMPVVRYASKATNSSSGKSAPALQPPLDKSVSR